MPMMETYCMENKFHVLGDDMKARLSGFLLNVYPFNTAKLIAQDIKCSPDTAYKWVEGSAFPSRPDHLAKLIAAYGQPLMDAVFSPIITDHLTLREARLEAEKQKIERDLAALKEARRASSFSH